MRPSIERPLQHLTAARKIAPARVTKILAQHTNRLQNGWRASDSAKIRDNALKAIVITGGVEEKAA